MPEPSSTRNARIRSGVVAVILAVAAIFAEVYVESIFWPLIVLLIVCVLVLLATFDWFPLEWRGFRGRAQRQQDASDLRALARHVGLRGDIQRALTNLEQMKDPTPTPAALRAFADNLARRLRNAGYDMSASRVEVLLPDNTSAGDVKTRIDALDISIRRMLLWDEYE